MHVAVTTLLPLPLVFLCSVLSAPSAQSQEPLPTFKSRVDLVRLNAVARDKKGRFVRGLTRDDFEIADAGQVRPIADFQQDDSAVSVALLFDMSGSMEPRFGAARDAARHVLSWLVPGRDEEAVFAFDTRLVEVAGFHPSRRTYLPGALYDFAPFGATSLHDAVAETAQRLGYHEGRRRALIVLTDGDDNWSRLAPSEASEIASAIEVPVYILRLVSRTADPTANLAAVPADRGPAASRLGTLAARTGGGVFAVSNAVQRGAAAEAIIEELRHQYLIAIESSGAPGWHTLEVRTRRKDLQVRARSGYFAGQSRPAAN